MAANKALERGAQITMPVPAADNGGVGPVSGEPLLFGSGAAPSYGLAGVAQNSLTPPTGISTGTVSVDFEGVYFLTVTAKSSLSPSTGKAIAPGDLVYADGGTYDSVTGCTYGFTLDANSSTGVKFGFALDALTSGATGTIRVRLKVG